ncbi:Seven TM Receptor [Caenorhabditis elegans]|uniref:Seven TM Receptor n=1 Tax=Caenorhabditis elegans TaxID=6239 RepID=A0A0K3AYD9_CAEEL|nr:Seven TM Receptor [Caenorhabditis elegans]CTQ86983.1 Seven TM Receptor [Caenorhabditis elegans]|eukprot:NP_001300284.1 Seven TM Receptor [Caenorhabditis elegans]
MVDWLLIDQTIAQLGFYTTTTSQLTLIFLTLFFVRKDLGPYKYLIILFSVFGIAFASFEFVLYPVLHSYNSGYIFFTSSRPLNASNEVMKIMLVLYTAMYSTTISLLAVQFLYRYFAIFHEYYLKYFKGWYFLIWIVYAGWFGCQYAIGFLVFNAVDEYSEEYMRQEMHDVYGLNVAEVPCVIHVIHQSIPNSTHSVIRWRNVFCTFNVTFIMVVQYGIMIFCGYQLYNEMEEKLSMLSKQMRRLHRQIFKTLMLQITTPTIVLFSPIVFVIYLPWLDLELSVPTGVFLSGFTLYPALDAFILMYVVTDYRRAFKTAFQIYKPSGASSQQ